jgi:hypothetical protein
VELAQILGQPCEFQVVGGGGGGGAGDSSAIRNFPPGHMLCKPCYKIIKRHASGIDTGYCAASHWSD